MADESRSWWRRFIVAMLALSLTVSCAPEHVGRDLCELVSLRQLAGRFVPSQPITVVPDRFWEADEESGSWSFRGWANLVFFVDEGGEDDPLRIRFVPDENTSQMHFHATWDEEDLGESWELVGDAISIVIPSEKMAPGFHRLKVQRDRLADDVETREIIDCRFAGIEVGSEKIQRLDPSDHQRLGLIRAFFEDEVVGISKDRYGGLLVSGGQSLRTRLTTSSQARISFQVSAFFAPKTRFIAEVDGVEHQVQAGAESVELDFEVAAGDHEL